MAGTKKRTWLIAELARRTQEALGDDATSLDYVADWIADGKTILDLARDIARTTGESCSREFVSRHIHLTYGEEAKRRLTAARMAGAHALAEEAQQIVDNAPEQREALQKVRMQVNVRQWLAERYNQGELGGQKGAQVAVTIQQLHLDALRICNAQRAAAQPAAVEAVGNDPPKLPEAGEFREARFDAA